MKKLTALILASGLAVSLAGCSTPATVGTIGDVEIPAGVYLYTQLSAYESCMGLATDVEDTTVVKDVLKATVTDSTQDPAVEMTGADYVAKQTTDALDYYAGVNTLFAQMDGELTEENQTQLEGNTTSRWTSYGDKYTQNGIGQQSLQLVMEANMKANQLLDMLYGENGTEAVTDAEMKKFLAESCVTGSVIQYPLLDYTTYAMADETQTADIEALAQQAADAINEGTDLVTAATDTLGKAYEVMGDTTTDESTMLMSNVGEQTLYPGDIAYYDTDEGNTITDVTDTLEVGQAGVINLGTAILVFVKGDTETLALDDVRSTLVGEMKSEELQDRLLALGAELPHSLSDSAMKTYSVNKIKE